MHLFIVGDFFRRRRRPRRANDHMPAQPLLDMLLFWVSFGLAVLFGSLAVVMAMGDSYAAAAASGILCAASLAASVVLWRKLNR